MLLLRRFLLLVFILMLLKQGSAFSEERAYEMPIILKNKEALSSAYGVIIHENPSRDSKTLLSPQAGTRRASVKDLGKGLWEITVELTSEDYKPNTKLTVIARTSSGETLPGPVRWISKASMGTAAQVTCKLEENKAILKKILALNKEALTTLVAIRNTRRQVLAHELKARLTPDVILKLDALEQEFGVTHPQPISSKLSLKELAYRLGALNAFIENQ